MCPARPATWSGVPPNKRMKLTKLSAAPFRGWRRRLMPAPARLDAGTASQLIRGVGRTQGAVQVPSQRRRSLLAVAMVLVGACCQGCALHSSVWGSHYGWKVVVESPKDCVTSEGGSWVVVEPRFTWDGTVVDGLEVIITSRGVHKVRSRVRASGTARLGPLSAGRYAMRLRLPEGPELTCPAVAVPDGCVLHVTMSVEPPPADDALPPVVMDPPGACVSAEEYSRMFSK